MEQLIRALKRHISIGPVILDHDLYVRHVSAYIHVDHPDPNGVAP